MAAEAYDPELPQELVTVDVGSEGWGGRLPEATTRWLAGLLHAIRDLPEELHGHVTAAHYGAVGEPTKHMLAAAAFTILDVTRTLVTGPEDPDALVRRDLERIEAWLIRHRPD